ncbi:hypothetical protein DFJ74DRAFT_355580 [Hyaloraphidium curvatum]|nr:hypothetical protein DFJ74DRAFT_355580 [Hyaloraphidium curvatum]
MEGRGRELGLPLRTLETAGQFSTMSFTVKVAYDGVLRRFPIEETASWAQVAGQIQRLPRVTDLAPSSFFVGYRDQEGDIIAIDSDAELAELFALAKATGNNTLRFEVVLKHGGKATPIEQLLSNEDLGSLAPESDVDMAVAGDANGASEAQGAQQTHAAENKPAAEDKGKEPAPAPDGSGPAFEQVASVISHFHDMFQNKPGMAAHMQAFSRLFENGDGEFDVEALKGKLQGWASHVQEHLGGSGRPGEEGGGPWWAPFARQWFENMQAAHQHDEADTSAGIASSSTDNHAERVPYGGRGGRTWPGPYGRGPFGWMHRDPRGSEAARTPDPRPTPAEIEEKVSTLHSMGFLGDDENLRGMLERYGGNVERVVELLVRA